MIPLTGESTVAEERQMLLHIAALAGHGKALSALFTPEFVRWVDTRIAEGDDVGLLGRFRYEQDHARRLGLEADNLHALVNRYGEQIEEQNCELNAVGEKYEAMIEKCHAQSCTISERNDTICALGDQVVLLKRGTAAMEAKIAELRLEGLRQTIAIEKLRLVKEPPTDEELKARIAALERRIRIQDSTLTSIREALEEDDEASFNDRALNG